MIWKHVLEEPGRAVAVGVDQGVDVEVLRGRSRPGAGRPRPDEVDRRGHQGQGLDQLGVDAP